MVPRLEVLEGRDMPSGIAPTPTLALPTLSGPAAFFAAGEQAILGINQAATNAFAQATTLGPRGIQLFGPQIVNLAEAAFTLENEIVVAYLAQFAISFGGTDAQAG